MIQATFAMLTLAAVLFTYRLSVGPILADRIIALNGLLLVGMGAIATHAATRAWAPFSPRSSPSPSSVPSATA